ncbi:MAG: hypothetical protein JRI23_02235 [Deltaproteobacteria bacterium]|jgi:hypothetical protein|nr:hypothetical protein [Deltaproteobacteria bacterium]MBW2530300.1 hypothetical protein [Deltaproteobacteria bacterium]
MIASYRGGRHTLPVLLVAALVASCADDRSGGAGGGAPSSSVGGGGQTSSSPGGSGSGAYAPFTLSCSRGEAWFVGTLDGTDYDFVAEARACPGSPAGGSVHCSARSVLSDSNDIDVLIEAAPTAGYIVGEQVVSARVFVKLFDDTARANCAAEPTERWASLFSYGGGKTRFIAERLRTSSSLEPCTYDSDAGYTCPVFDDVCAGAPVEGRLEGCLWPD